MPTVHTIAGEPVLEGKYQIECRLGQGGMGVVYKARHAYLKTQLAIKVILPDLVGNDPQLVTRFRQEALAAAAIRHQNVVSVTDYGVIGGTVPFLVMEYVEGESLHDLLVREKSLSPERAFDLISAVCAGVGAAHHQGIVHRDLKPLNIMICSDKPTMAQAVKILDFGLAKIKSGELLGSFIQAQTTGLMGSPYYMAPEQWADEDPDSRSDIYSLGVMLYQMLAGDVPFKGSSIPAIMKKHISDRPPTLAESGVNANPELEKAILHTLQKKPDDRTATVEEFVDELREAIHPGQQFLNTARSLPVSTLKITSKPPRSSVFVDNVSVGDTRDDGHLLVEGIQSGNHRLRLSHAGFQDWHGDVVFDGKPREIVAELRQGNLDSRSAIPKPDFSVSSVGRKDLSTQYSPDGPDEMEQTVQQNFDPDRFDVSVVTAQPKKGGVFAPWLLGIGGLLALFLIGIIGLGSAYMLGVFGDGGVVPPSNVSTSPTPSNSPAQFTAEMVQIPGGTFRMGRNAGGRDNERPENSVTVQSFRMDKFEVTNGEYVAFVSETGYTPIPAHWVINQRPAPGTERMPVRFVNIDDVAAFAGWRSKRDNVIYRLPTEAEWEYSARSGARQYLYPWGNEFDPKCAVTDKDNTAPDAVGTASCPNDWGVMDLIGNVNEWTSSEAALYQGSPGQMRKTRETRHMIRGGAAFNKAEGEFAVTSTFRHDVAASTRDAELGFRLVTDN